MSCAARDRAGVRGAGGEDGTDAARAVDGAVGGLCPLDWKPGQKNLDVLSLGHAA